MAGANIDGRMASADELIQQLTRELADLESQVSPNRLWLDQVITPPSNVQSRPLRSTVLDPVAPEPVFGEISPILNNVPLIPQQTPSPTVMPYPVFPPRSLETKPVFQPKIHASTMSESHKALFKARDIEVLKLKDLCKIDSKSGKRFFFKQIRQLGGNEVDQVQLALSRMDRELRLFVGNRLETTSIQTLDTVERILDAEFTGPQSLADSIRELYSNVYTIDENPRQFAHIFKTKFEALCTAYPDETRPDRTEVLKHILVQNLPGDMRQSMQCFMTKGFGEDLFIAELERERVNRKIRVSVVQDLSKVCPNKVDTDVRSETAVRDNVYVPARNRTNEQRPQSSYPYQCRYCQNGQRHGPRECPRCPAPRACFDCLSMTHRQGSVQCPGRSGNGNVITSPNQAQQ